MSAGHNNHGIILLKQGLVRFDRNGNRQASSNVLLQYRMKGALKHYENYIHPLTIDNATITQPIGIVMDRLDLFGNASESDIWPGITD